MRYPPNISEVQQTFPDFEVICQIGQGGQKTVFEVVRKADNKRFVLKILNPQASIERVQREIQAMLVVDSPYVAGVAEYQQRISPTGGITFIIEDFIPGEVLRTKLEIGTIYTPDAAIKFLDMVLQGLQACAEKNIVHRDIKPENIIIRPDESPVIIDFGIARHLDQTSLTETSRIWGICTPPYASPEVLEYRKDQIDARSDLFSLGVTGYEMLTGSHPLWVWGDRNDLNFERMLRHTPQPLTALMPAIPEELSKFILRMMNKDRFRRFRDAAFAREKLRVIALDCGITI